MVESLPRVMWLLNHPTARKFELAMLKKLGFTEFFLPKNFPQDVTFRSASVDYSEDAALTIPAGDLAILNAADWYSGPDRNTWEIANRHFDLLFFIAWGETIFGSVSRHFRGAAILRAYGLSEGYSYGGLVDMVTGGRRTLESLGRRFWLGTAYDNLGAVEPPWFQGRELYLPLGLADCRIREDWTGINSSIFFVCPDVASNPYYRDVYRDFKHEFAGFPYAVGGAQSVSLSSSDPHLLGFVPREEHQKNMREFRVMFYHSTEPTHVHYTPFEGVQAGMPLVFMGGGLLDRLGGIDQPGRCRSYREARAKIRRILDGDRSLIDKIRTNQVRLLDQMRPEVLERAWQRGIPRVLSELKTMQVRRPGPLRRRRIAVMLPLAYRGGTLRSAKLLAQALWTGSRQAGEDAEVVFCYPEAESAMPDQWDSDLPPAISRRLLKWTELERDAALRAMRFAGNSSWRPFHKIYLAPDDGVRQMYDCDLWIVVSDRLTAPLLPIRPHVLAVYDYIQRYNPDILPVKDVLRVKDETFLAAARHAERILVTTRFTEQDALVYAGVARDKVFRVPMLIPEFTPGERPSAVLGEPYFLWTTNLGPHKNHHNAATALREYYERMDGRLECRVSGVHSESLLESDLPHLQSLAELAAESEALRSRVRILGEVPDARYRRQLSGARFLWHPARIDNGSLTVVEAAQMGVPSLSSRYPAMEEMDANFGLHLTWMNAQDPDDMARQLKWMEENACQVRNRLPRREELAEHCVERVAGAYWSVTRECL
jgi:glycosyltransferase involved in cell wall biosynthesis